MKWVRRLGMASLGMARFDGDVGEDVKKCSPMTRR